MDCSLETLIISCYLRIILSSSSKLCGAWYVCVPCECVLGIQWNPAGAWCLCFSMKPRVLGALQDLGEESHFPG